MGKKKKKKEGALLDQAEVFLELGLGILKHEQERICHCS